VGILYLGAEPEVDPEVNIRTGDPGNGGLGVDGHANTVGENGVDDQILSLP
jgi:hypothetical protein